MNALYITFIGASAFLWFSIYGYLFFLWVKACRKPRPVPKLSECPQIALVIPTLNEEGLILSKLKDLENSDYPSRRINVLVVDGGSADRTAEHVKGKPTNPFFRKDVSVCLEMESVFNRPILQR